MEKTASPRKTLIVSILLFTICLASLVGTVIAILVSFFNKPLIVVALAASLSALLTTTMGGQKDVIDALTEAGLRDKVRVMVGGAPVTREYADEIGADCYTLDAASAAKEAVRLIREMRA